jgi:hypothetical protein
MEDASVAPTGAVCAFFVDFGPSCAASPLSSRRVAVIGADPSIGTPVVDDIVEVWPSTSRRAR